jgi:hypothetical protein
MEGSWGVRVEKRWRQGGYFPKEIKKEGKREGEELKWTGTTLRHAHFSMIQ